MFIDLMKKCRSYRRFQNDVKIPEEKLKGIVEAARYAPSACNFQRLRYVIVTEGEIADGIFETLSFANYLKKEWPGPTPNERPVAYIVIMTDQDFDTLLAIDAGLVAQSMVLAAASEGYGACIFRGFNRDRLTEVMNKDGYTPELVIALGVPSEQVKIVDVKDGNIKYYRDENSVHYVPKRSLEDLII